MGTPSAQTLDHLGVREFFQELEEVPMTMVGGFDVHRQQITFDYVDDDGLVHWGQIRPATRKTLRGWLAEHCPDGDGEFALEGCTGWRYVSEELAAADVGMHLGDPAEIAALRGPKKRAKTDRADARYCARCCWRGGSRSRGSRRRTCWRPARPFPPSIASLSASGGSTWFESQRFSPCPTRPGGCGGSAPASRSFVLAALRALHLDPAPRPHR